ncbi:MAG: acetylornithine deacetylase [Rhodovulum sulfidophilum]|uniref:Acetylornithine deacetylase n=1 Tax=Rhodovulum sulfidophilum TaxID=35806 RepID=A0A2W5NDS0_RHOSU|nr:MAG: acetylornithine deacetylase [Rhodovulum sulfidophilum]
METLDILERLIAFPTVSRDPNAPLMDYVAETLRAGGIEPVLIPNADGSKANLFASVGGHEGGVMLSGHTDVVPVDGQDWTRAPFALTRDGGRLYGRGAADMKGFVASAIAAMLRARRMDLASPLHLALSYDEELGCLGVHSLIELIARGPARPAMCIVGEPTELRVATGHKGKTGMRATCRGVEAHSALAPTGLNALHLAADLMAVIRAEQARVAEEGARDGDYDVPYSTLHVGKLNGGVALNIVPNLAVMDFELRNVAADRPDAVLAPVHAAAERLTAEARARFPEAGIEIEVFNTYPGLDTPGAAEVVRFVQSLTGANGTIKVAFGTEGGLFTEKLGLPTVVCGPGSMAQGHKPDEFVTEEQLGRCDAMLDTLLDRLRAGL